MQALVTKIETHMPIDCDNQVAILIAKNFAFHEHTENIKIKCNFICDEMLKGLFQHRMCLHQTISAISSPTASLVCLMTHLVPS